MDSLQSIVSPVKNLSVTSKPTRLVDSGYITSGLQAQRKEAEHKNSVDFIGVLDVHVHRARDIQNICIYHKQDVYSKLCLTSDPDAAVSTKIINGGGQNPVFEDSVCLNVRTINSSLKCEIWMMSRVRNYLEDQLLGFALVPMSDIVIQNGKVEKEFTLSSTDLFHSPAGFVRLSLSYSGASPEVMEIPTSLANSAVVQGSEISESETNDFCKIEFPDPKVVNENELMVSEYIGISCSSIDDSQSTGSLFSDNENQLKSELGAQVADSKPYQKQDSFSFNESSPASSQVSENDVVALKSLNPEQVSEVKVKKNGHRDGDGESDSSSSALHPLGNASAKTVLTANLGQEQKVVQQDIVDMYMKSMQQFTESLAKMKLPLDIESGPHSSINSSTADQKVQTPNNGQARVFYGSRAFF